MDRQPLFGLLIGLSLLIGFTAGCTAAQPTPSAIANPVNTDTPIPILTNTPASISTITPTPTEINTKVISGCICGIDRDKKTIELFTVANGSISKNIETIQYDDSTKINASADATIAELSQGQVITTSLSTSLSLDSSKVREIKSLEDLIGLRASVFWIDTGGPKIAKEIVIAFMLAGEKYQGMIGASGFNIFIPPCPKHP